MVKTCESGYRYGRIIYIYDRTGYQLGGMNTMWAYESVFYQIYPLGFCGAPFENDGVESPRILKVGEWIPHMKRLGINAVYFSPVFESDTHGYNTRDYKKIDCRLGSNQDFR